jgi:hypothetical protein
MDGCMDEMMDGWIDGLIVSGFTGAKLVATIRPPVPMP